jgi:hypothetical protein
VLSDISLFFFLDSLRCTNTEVIFVLHQLHTISICLLSFLFCFSAFFLFLPSFIPFGLLCLNTYLAAIPPLRNYTLTFFYDTGYRFCCFFCCFLLFQFDRIDSATGRYAGDVGLRASANISPERSTDLLDLEVHVNSTASLRRSTSLQNPKA